MHRREGREGGRAKTNVHHCETEDNIIDAIHLQWILRVVCAAVIKTSTKQRSSKAAALDGGKTIQSMARPSSLQKFEKHV